MPMDAKKIGVTPYYQCSTLRCANSEEKVQAEIV